MKTNDETVLENVSMNESLNEETKLESQTENLEIDNEVQEEAGDSAESRRKSWKQVAMGGVSGIALGAAGILFSGATLPEEMVIGGGENNNGGSGEDINVEDNIGESPLAPGIESEAGISVATGVNDDMSFSEAFASARHEVGANGAFVWHGQVYSTCYAEEWNALSPEDQEAFSSNALAAVGDHHAPSDSPETLMAENNTTTNDADPGLAENDDVQDDSDSVEVHVLGVEENVVTDDGDVINVGVAEVEGHSAMFIDGDADGTFDLLAVDVNDDGYIDVDNEVFEVDNPDMNVETFSDASPMTSDPIVDDMYAQMPDYTNDADVSSLA